MHNQMESAKIMEQVSCILDTPSFKKSKILSDFLHFIVSETLGGKEHFLKEYVIATKVLKKNSDFNPQSNSIIRIHAQRLRERLADYYKGEGVNDTIIISIPKGRYIPVFETNTSTNGTQPKNAPMVSVNQVSEPIIAVLPLYKFQSYTRLDIICSVMKQDLCTELSKFNGIKVISNYSVTQAAREMDNIEDFLAKLNVSYVITGSCLIEDEKLKINIELNYRLNNQIVWAESFILDDFKDNELSYFRLIIKKILAKLCGHFGLIYKNELNSHHPTDYSHLYAVYCYKEYHRELSEEAFHKALEAVTTGLNVNPKDALLTAFHGEIYLNLLIMDVEGEMEFLKVGTQLANKSVELDDNNQHGYQVLAWANLLNHDKNALYRSAEKCIQINPNNVNYIGAIGFGYVCAGDYEKGFELMSASVSLNPYFELSVTVGFVLYYIHANKLEAALDWAEKIKKKALIWDPLLRVSIVGLLNRTKDFENLKKELYSISPNFNNRARTIVSKFILDKELQNKIIEGLILAGVEIQD